MVLLDEPVAGITPASLPEPYVVDELIGTTVTPQRFMDVGYGQNGVTVGGGFPIGNFDFVPGRAPFNATTPALARSARNIPCG